MPNDRHPPADKRGTGKLLNRRQVVLGLAAAGSAAVLGAAMKRLSPAPTLEHALEQSDTSDPQAEGRAVAESAGIFHVLQQDEARAIWFLGTLAIIKGHGDDTGGLFGAVEFTHPPGFATPLHLHNEEDEAFYVLEGTIRGMCDGREWTAAQGDFVWLPRMSRHGYMVVGDDTVRTLAFSIPAGFEQFVMEAGDPARERTIPPPSPPDFARLGAAAGKYGQEILGPLEFPVESASGA
jgi:quercetin dioxygenase-like cupin family protein